MLKSPHVRRQALGLNEKIRACPLYSAISTDGTREYPALRRLSVPLQAKRRMRLGRCCSRRRRSLDVEIPSQLRADYNINDCLNGVILLGGDWVELEKFDDRKFLERPTIDEWMTNRVLAPTLSLCAVTMATRSDTFSQRSTAMWSILTPGGRRIKFDAVPPRYRTLRIKRTFLVFDRE